MMALKSTFQQLASTKSRGIITGQSFSKLANYKFIRDNMISKGFQKSELMIVFLTIANSKKEVDFLNFCLVMQKLFSEKVSKYVKEITFEMFV